MTEAPTLHEVAGRRVGVLGLARSGLAAARALRAAGAEVLAFDDKPAALAAAAELGVPAGRIDDVAGLAALVVSPGVPLTHPAPHGIIAAAALAGVPLTGDIDLFATRHPDLPIVGITGTNGKSTTTALAHHLLTVAGRPALIGGNIGRPVLDLPPPEPGAVAVLELSSFQLELCTRLRCKVAVWLNLTADHLDRHGDLATYIAAKRRIFAGQGPADHAVLGIDDPASAALADGLEAAGCRVVRIALGRTVEGGVGVIGGVLYEAMQGRPMRVADLGGARGLKGAHNHQNAAAAYAAVRCLGLSPAQAALGLANFQGLPHRMEEVGRIGKVTFVNDSKATNPDSAATSLAAYADVFWIAGGQAKPGGFAAVLQHLSKVRTAYLIGSATAELEAAFAGRVPHRACGTLAEATRTAFADAQRSAAAAPVILLAPACASYDQFKSFEHRGDSFRQLVGELEGTPLLFAEVGR